MNTKHKTFAEYDDELTHACQSTLGMLPRAFGTLAPTLRLVGGLMPRYRTPAQRRRRRSGGSA
jgi:hypothetical protein